MRYASLPALGLSAWILTSGCATPEPPKEEEPPSPMARAPREPEPPSIVQAGRYLIYDVQWLRAEEVAETLRPILESRYGAGVVIQPHIATNKLIIYIPSRAEQEAMRGQGGTAGIPAQASPGTQTRGTVPGAPGSQGTQTSSSRRRASVTGSR